MKNHGLSIQYNSKVLKYYHYYCENNWYYNQDNDRYEVNAYCHCELNKNQLQSVRKEFQY